jgi:hypothetical protein
MILTSGYPVDRIGLLFARDNATPAEIRMKAWQHHQRLKEELPFKDLEWRIVGPEFCGGRIETIACHPDEKNPNK